MVPRGRRAAFAGVLLLLTLLVAALGTWQVERRGWKLALIAAVDARAGAPAVPAPGPGAWDVTAAADGYRHVRVAGTWLHERETLVRALTVLGAGSWVMTPLRTPEGWTVLVNRGFVPSDRADPASRAGQAKGAVLVSGLLRVTEPGNFLQHNDPARNDWTSRDVAAIAAARGLDRGLDRAAPYFIDADDTPNPGGLPVGGLTVISFPNNHLLYAITWFGLAGLGVAGLVRVLRPATPDPPTGA